MFEAHPPAVPSHAPAVPGDRAPIHALDAEVARELARLLSELRFGSVEIVVHDGAITQIERRERLRIAGVPSRRV